MWPSLCIIIMATQRRNSRTAALGLKTQPWSSTPPTENLCGAAADADVSFHVQHVCSPLVHDVSEGGEGQQDVAGHPQEGELGKHLQPTQPVRKTYIRVGKSWNNTVVGWVTTGEKQERERYRETVPTVYLARPIKTRLAFHERSSGKVPSQGRLHHWPKTSYPPPSPFSPPSLFLINTSQFLILESYSSEEANKSQKNWWSQNK